MHILSMNGRCLKDEIRAPRLGWLGSLFLGFGLVGRGYLALEGGRELRAGVEGGVGAAVAELWSQESAEIRS